MSCIANWTGRIGSLGTWCLVFGGMALAPGVDVEAAQRWRWSNPMPHGNNIVDVVWSDSWGQAVQVTERGGIYTSDGSGRWIPRDSGTRLALRGVAFLGERAVIVGEAGTVLYGDAPHAFRRGTLRDGPVTDWFESVAASEAMTIAVGDNGAVYSSLDGAVWDRQNSNVEAWLRGVAYGAGTFVAVGEEGTVITSGEGRQWSRVDVGTERSFNRVSFGGGKFLAVGDAGLALMSSDGLNWEAEETGATGDLFGAAVGDGVRLVVGDEELRLFDGGEWGDVLGQAGGPPDWTYYAVLSGPTESLVVGRTGLVVEGFRSGEDAYEWSVQSPSVRSWLFDVAWVEGLFVAVGDRGTVLTSGSGAGWALELVPSALTNAVFLGVGGTTNLVVAVGSQGALLISPNGSTNLTLTNSQGIVVTQEVSTLGVLWHAVQPAPTGMDLQGVTYHAGRYYVTGDNGLVLSSERGTNWTGQSTPTTQFLSGIAGFSGGLAACGKEGALIFSPDGSQWQEVSSGTTNWLYRVRAVNGQLLAVGQNGTILASTNGMDWVRRESGSTEWFQDVVWIDHRYFIVGTAGTVISSDDGVEWEDAGTITGKSLSGAAHDGARLVVVGSEGAILRSPVVPDKTPVEIVEYSRIAGEEADTVRNVFLFGGRMDQRFTLDSLDPSIANGWETGPELEFLDVSGTLIYLETESLSGAAPAEYYRGTLTP
jgi:hypothetical protein